MSAAGRRNLLATSPSTRLHTALEITHPDLAEPVRVVNDTQDIVIEGHIFTACAFQLVKMDDVDQQLPRATLSVDNIGRELTQWLEYSNGGRGAMCRIMDVLRDDPVSIEYDFTVAMSEMSITYHAVSANLSVQKSMGQPAVAVRYDPTTAIGIFD